MADAAAAIAVDDEPAERGPVVGFVARLLEELAPSRGRGRLARVEIPTHGRQRRAGDGVLRLAEDEERARLRHRDDVHELPSLEPRPVVDHAPVGELDDVALHRDPRAEIEERPSRARLPGAHRQARPTLRRRPDVTRRLVQRDRPRSGDVQRLGPARQRDRDLVAACNLLVRQPLALGAEEERHRRGEVGLLERRAAVGRERHAPGRAVVPGRQRDAEDRAGRGSERLRRQRIRAPFGERHACAERVGGPQERADVARIGEAPQRKARLAGARRQVGAAVHADGARRVRERRHTRKELRLDRLAGDRAGAPARSRSRGPRRRGPPLRRRTVLSPRGACAVRGACGRA